MRSTHRGINSTCRSSKKGKLRDIEILRAHNDVCREKTIETLKKSPRWTPGTANGVPVDVRYETSFKFQYR